MATNTGVNSTVSTGTFDVDVADGSRITIWASPRLKRGETVKVYHITDGAASETEMVLDKRTIEVTWDNTAVQLAGPLSIRGKKSETEDATTVFYEQT